MKTCCENYRSLGRTTCSKCGGCLYDVDFDEASGLWCVFLGDKAIASFCSREEAQEHLDRLLG